MALTTLYLKCPCASSEQDVQETLNSTFSPVKNCVDSVQPIKMDKHGNKYTFVDIIPSPPFMETRMDRLIASLRESSGASGERFCYYSDPKKKIYIEWSVKLAVPKEETFKKSSVPTRISAIR
jgi:hypothetical protein